MFDAIGSSSEKPAGTVYRHILSDAWRTLRKNKALWLLGFFASFLGNGGVYELLVQGTGRLGLQDPFGQFFMLGLLPGEGTIGDVISRVGFGNALLFLLVILTVIALFLVAAWVVVSAQGGLIAGVRDAERGKATRFGSLFAAGNEVFAPLFLIALLARLAMMAFFYLLLALTVLYLADANVWSVLAYLAGFIFLIPITVIIGFVAIYAACYVTLQRLRFVEAVETAIALFRRYWLISLEVAFLLFVVNLLTAVVIGLIMGAGGVALLPLVLGASTFGGGGVMAVLTVVASLVAVGVLAVAGAGLSAFQYAVWVHLFQKLHRRGHGIRSKLARWFDRLMR